MLNRRVIGLAASAFGLLLAGSSGLLAQDTQPQDDKPAAEAPVVDTTPKFGPRGVRIRPPAGSEFGKGNVIPGPYNVPGWAEAKANKALSAINDPDVASVVGLLSGSLASEPITGGGPGGDMPALVLGMGRIDVTGLDNAVYFEISRADAQWKPYRQGVFHAYKAGGNLRLRVFGFGGMPSFGDAVVGLWAAPEIFPDINVSSLVPIVDIPLTKAGTGFQGQSAGRIPVVTGGAVEAEMAISIGTGQISLTDRGYDASGKQVTGLGTGKAVAFKDAPSKLKVTKREDGMYIVDLVPPTAGALAAQADANSRIAVHYSGWLYTDGWKFASSRDVRWDGAAPEPQVFNMQAKLLAGWSKGMPGMTKGTIRRLIVPSGMAFHTSGSQPWRVPPEMPVIFEVECLWVEDKPADAAPATAQPTEKAADPAKTPEK